MKHLPLTLLFLISTAMSLSAQDVIAKQSHGQTTFYYITAPYTRFVLQPILDSTQTGDTLYLPAANFSLGGNLYIKSGVVIVGAGADPDSTVLTHFDNASSAEIIFQNGSSNAEMHGIDFENQIFLSVNVNDVTSGIKFYRCRMAYLVATNSNAFNHITNLSFKGCVMDYLDLAGASTVIVDASYVHTIEGAVSGTVFSNNIIAGGSGFGSSSPNQGVVYKNNVILFNTNSPLNVNEHSSFTNNAWVLNVGGSLTFGINIISQNQNPYWTSLSAIFAYWYNPTDYATFSFVDDLHIINPVADTLGVGHTQVGIYGAQYQWKDGMVPFNPHWISLNVASNTNNGLLGISIGASAQDPNISLIKRVRFWSDRTNPPADMQYINFTPQRVINYDSFIDFCSSSYSGTTNFYYQLQDNLGNWSVVTSAQPYIATGAPSSVTIYDNGTGLQSDAAYGNQWYLNGAIIPGATGQFYTPIQNGSYTSVVTNNCGSATSNALTYTVSGITEVTPDAIKLYPNPNNGTFKLLLNDISVPSELTITNTLGETIFSQPITMKETPISLTTTSGLYFATLRNGSHSFFQKIIITH